MVNFLHRPKSASSANMVISTFHAIEDIPGVSENSFEGRITQTTYTPRTTQTCCPTSSITATDLRRFFQGQLVCSRYDPNGGFLCHHNTLLYPVVENDFGGAVWKRFRSSRGWTKNGRTWRNLVDNWYWTSPDVTGDEMQVVSVPFIHIRGSRRGIAIVTRMWG